MTLAPSQGSRSKSAQEDASLDTPMMLSNLVCRQVLARWQRVSVVLRGPALVVLNELPDVVGALCTSDVQVQDHLHSAFCRCKAPKPKACSSVAGGRQQGQVLSNLLQEGPASAPRTERPPNASAAQGRASRSRPLGRSSASERKWNPAIFWGGLFPRSPPERILERRCTALHLFQGLRPGV